LVFNIASVLTRHEQKILDDEINKYFKNDIHYKINSNAEFKVQKGKKKSFISHIN